MNNLRLLIKKDIKQIKNYFLEFKTNPKKILPVIFYIAWLGFMIKSNSNDDFYSINYFKNFSFGILSFLLVISIMNVYFERTSYFNLADINLLFTSPISSKLLLIYAIFKTSWKQLLAALFMFFFLTPSLIAAGVPFIKMLIGILSYSLFIFAIEPLCFLISRIGKKYNLKIVITIFILFFLILIFIPMIILKSPLKGIQSQLMNFIPIIGWSRGIFMGMFYNDSNIYIYLLLQLFFILITNIYIIKTSSNYFEDVLITTENKASYLKKRKSGKASLNISFNFNKNKKITINTNHFGSDAFHWKNKLKSMREDYHYFFGVQTLLFLIISIGIPIIKNIKNIEMSYTYIYMTSIFIILYIYTLFSMRAGGQEELEFPLFYLIPEPNFKKIISINKLSFERFAINSIVFLITPLIIDTSNLIIYIFMFLVFNSIYWVIKYSHVLIKSIFRNETDFTFMLPLIKIFQLLLIILPSIVASIITGFLIVYININFQLTMLINIFILNLIVSILILTLSDFIISRIEI